MSNIKFTNKPKMVACSTSGHVYTSYHKTTSWNKSCTLLKIWKAIIKNKNEKIHLRWEGQKENQVKPVN